MSVLSMKFPRFADTNADNTDNTELVLRPSRCGKTVDLAELWKYRDLLWYLGLRDIQVRYKQTLLGAAWAIVQPFVMMIVFCVVFGQVMGLRYKIDVPYPIFTYAGLLPWMFFANSVTASSNSLVQNAHMLRKIYFPRLMLPLAAIGAPLIDYLIAFIVLIGLMFWYDVSLTWSIMLLPLLIGTTIIAAAGTGIFLAAVTVKYRDFRHVVPFMIQVGLFVTPVIYPIKIEASWGWVLNLNPMAGTIDAFRAMILGSPIDYSAWLISLSSALFILTAGLTIFHRNERSFADLI